MSLFSMTDRTVLVTGGAGYLGLPVCLGLKEQGANVIVADRDETRLAEATVALQSAPGSGAVAALRFDASDEAETLDMLDRAVAAFGRLDGLVVATAYNSGKALDDLDGETFDLANRINLTNTFLLARAAADIMPDGGSVVLYSSMYGVVSPDPKNYPGDMIPNAIEYGVGKSGLNQMVRTLAGHFGPRNIRFNALYPGPFPPEVMRESHPEFIDNLEADTMLGRIGRRDETAGAAIFLLSNAASYITGQMLGVDGGWTAW